MILDELILDTAVPPAPLTEQETLAMLLRDREWLDAEFAAIMNASGIGDRVIVGTVSDRPRGHPRVRDADERWHLPDGLPAAGVNSRVRSPPSRS